MTITDLASTAQALVAGGKGILEADETPGTPDKTPRRFQDRIDAG
jgi:fructose-bisphosphate aldolase class 1